MASLTDENSGPPNLQSPLVSQQDSPSVRIHITVKDTKDCHLKEVIRKVTKRWETVEVDGFTFRRKRGLQQGAHASPGPSKRLQTGSPLANIPATGAGLLQQYNSPAAMASPMQDHKTAQTAEPSADTDQGGASTGTPTPVTPLQGEPVTQAQLPVAQLSGEEVQQLREAVQQGLPPGGSAPERLIALCRFLLQEEVRVSGASLGEPAVQVLQEVAEQLPAAVDAAVSDGTLHLCTASEADMPGDAASGEVDWDGRRTLLQRQLANFQEEEAGWESVMQEAAAMANQEPSVQEANALAVEQAADAGMQGCGAGALQQAQSRAQQKICLQVRGLDALVTGVEDLVAQAKQVCSVLQAGYHRDKFRNFPHVESPARLIQEIVRPSFRQSNLLPLLQ